MLIMKQNSTPSERTVSTDHSSPVDRAPAVKNRLGSISEEWLRPDGTLAKRVKKGVVERASAAAMAYDKN